MKLVRVLAGALLLSLAAIGAALWYATRYQNQLVSLILTQLAQRTGLQIQPSAARLGLGARLVVVLDYRLPELDGIGVLRQVVHDRQLARRHAFVLMTAARVSSRLATMPRSPACHVSFASTRAGESANCSARARASVRMRRSSVCRS